MHREQVSDFLRTYLDFIKGEEWAVEPNFDDLYPSFELAILELSIMMFNIK